MAQIQSGAGADLLTIDAASKAARATLYDTAGASVFKASGTQPDVASGVITMGLNDHAALPLRIDRLGSLATSTHQPLLMESFEGATINTARWTSATSAMTGAQSTSTGYVVNSGLATAATNNAGLQSMRRFMKASQHPLLARFRARFEHYGNATTELGFGDSVSSANLNGAYWQVSNTGLVQPVLGNNSVNQYGDDVSALIDQSKFYVYDVVAVESEVVFTIQDGGTGLVISRQVLTVPAQNARMWNATALPLVAKIYIGATAAAAAPRLWVTDVYCALLDANYNSPVAHTAALMHRDLTLHPHSGAALAQNANSAEPTNATLSNSAAGYTTLGGKFQFAAVGGAATDYGLFSYQVPIPSNFVVTGIDIEAWNLGAAVGTTPTLLTWSVAPNQVGVGANSSLQRVGLGAQDFPVGSPVGARAQRISKAFQTPLVCTSGRYFTIILRMPVATATASQVIAGMVNIEGYAL